MKKKRTCPKCGSKEISRFESSADGSQGGRENVIMVGWDKMQAIPLTRYVCRSCGYVEEWIQSEEDLGRLK